MTHTGARLPPHRCALTPLAARVRAHTSPSVLPSSCFLDTMNAHPDATFHQWLSLGAASSNLPVLPWQIVESDIHDLSKSTEEEGCSMDLSLNECSSSASGSILPQLPPLSPLPEGQRPHPKDSENDLPTMVELPRLGSVPRVLFGLPANGGDLNKTNENNRSSSEGKNESKGSKVKCPLCSYVTHKRNGIKHHLMTHSDHLSFGCHYCDYRSKWKFSIVRHMQYFCESSQKYAALPPSVNRLGFIKYFPPPPGDILWKCLPSRVSDVESSDNGKENEEVDQGSHFIKLEKRRSDFSKLQCPVCPLRAPRWRMNEHVAVHSQFRLYGCAFCEYRGKYRRTVERHMNKCLSARPMPQKARGALIRFFQPPPGNVLHEYFRDNAQR